MSTSLATRIIFIVLLYFTFFITDSFCQTPTDTTSSNYAVLRIDYCSNWITTSYGNNKTTQERLNRSKQLPIQDQIGDINNILADNLNKLKKQGYEVVTSTSDVNNGNTCGLTYILVRNPINK
jgi:hypothetical protein